MIILRRTMNYVFIMLFFILQIGIFIFIIPSNVAIASINKTNSSDNLSNNLSNNLSDNFSPSFSPKISPSLLDKSSSFSPSFSPKLSPFSVDILDNFSPKISSPKILSPFSPDIDISNTNNFSAFNKNNTYNISLDNNSKLLEQLKNNGLYDDGKDPFTNYGKAVKKMNDSDFEVRKSSSFTLDRQGSSQRSPWLGRWRVLSLAPPI